MIKITNFINYYDRNYEQYFEDTDMLEYKEDVLKYIINETLMGIKLNVDKAEIQECIAVNIRQYFQDTYIESTDVAPEDAEKDSYEFIYQYSILDELHNALKDTHFKYTESNKVKIDWSEDVIIDFLKIDNEIYLTFENSEIVKYTDMFDLYNSSITAKKGSNKLIDLSNELEIYIQITGEENSNMFFKLVEYYLFLKDRSLIHFYNEYKEIIPIDVKGNYADDYNLIEFETFKLIYPLFNQPKINNIKFNGWIRDTTKIRSTNV